MQRLCYSAAEVAAMLSLSERTVRRMLQGGSLPSVYIGSSVRIPAEAVEKLMRKAKVETKTEQDREIDSLAREFFR